VDRSEKLTGLLADFVGNVGSDFRIHDILDQLVKRIVGVLPVSGAGVMLMGARDELHFAAASNVAILAIETLQNELGEGPCLEAYRSGEAVSVPDLSTDIRFPRFSARARRLGLAAVFTFPMSLNGDTFGALDLYRDQPGVLDASDLAAAQMLADVAAAYIHSARGHADAEDTVDLRRQQSLHDPLTGLPNRTLLKERLDHAVARADRTKEAVAVLYVDLDHFKVVNDRHGHEIGDQLLVAVANRLSSVVRSSDTLARLSGDEFVIMCEGLENPRLAEHVAHRVVNALRPKFELRRRDLTVNLTASASVGIAFAGPGSEVPDSLLRDADFAMYQAKRAGGGTHHAFDQATRLTEDARGRLSRELRDALSREEFRLAYQPVVEVQHGTLVEVEALLRWRHPTRGWLLPNDFLPLAEPTGLIVEIGEWVLRQACEDLKRWQYDYGTAIPRVAVNVSPYQVMAPDLAATVARVLHATGTDPASISLEVTENALLNDGPRALAVLQQLKDVGVTLVLDDFGTGYSSLSYLRRFPFDVLKIDRTFIGGLAVDDGTYETVAAIIGLAHGLNRSVVAEGIETHQQLTQVTGLGTDRAQGYHICRPLLADRLDKRLLQPAGTAPIQLPLRQHPSTARTPHPAHLADVVRLPTQQDRSNRPPPGPS
jgi:diguanylate cyclase (GGDEF)-like protein